jgi:hypothetical protein
MQKRVKSKSKGQCRSYLILFKTFAKNEFFGKIKYQSDERIKDNLIFITTKMLNFSIIKTTLFIPIFVLYKVCINNLIKKQVSTSKPF